MRLTIVVLAVALLALTAGCKSPLGTDYTSTKRIIFEEGSIALAPMPVEVKEGEYETPPDGTTLTLADGSVLKLTGGGAAGNLFLINMQNDGTEQQVKTDAKADVKADVTPGGEPPGRTFTVEGR